MALVSPAQISDGTTIDAADVNNPINTIANDYNGNITDANISASAAIGGSKIATASIPTTTLINDWQTNYVLSGGVVAISSGLVGTFSNCTLVIDGYKMTLSSVVNKTYTASKDTYVDILRTGTTPSVVYTEVTNAAASPALVSSSLRLAKVVTSGSAITSVTQNPGSDSLGNTFRNTGLVSANTSVVPSKFSIYRNAAANSGNNAFAKIVFDTVKFDSGANVATGTFTAPVAGFYQFSWGALFPVSSAATAVTALYKNGAAFRWGNEVFASGAGGGGGTGGSVLAQSAASDTWEVYVFANGTTAMTVTPAEAAPYFTGFLVSAN